MQGSRTPEIMADAAYAILTKPSREFTGNFFIDEDVLQKEGVTDFAKYATVPGGPHPGLLPVSAARTGSGSCARARRRWSAPSTSSW